MSAAAVAIPAIAAMNDSATTTVTATAEILTPISLNHDSRSVLSFGTIIAGNGGIVSIPLTGGPSVFGDVILIGAPPTRDSFTVLGERGRAFSITSTGGTVSNGSNNMTFSTTVAETGTLDDSGFQRIEVGGRLSVGANQATGTYTGNYDVTVTYN